MVAVTAGLTMTIRSPVVLKQTESSSFDSRTSITAIALSLSFKSWLPGWHSKDDQRQIGVCCSHSFAFHFGHFKTAGVLRVALIILDSMRTIFCTSLNSFLVQTSGGSEVL